MGLSFCLGVAKDEVEVSRSQDQKGSACQATEFRLCRSAK